MKVVLDIRLKINIVIILIRDRNRLAFKKVERLLYEVSIYDAVTEPRNVYMGMMVELLKRNDVIKDVKTANINAISL